MHFDQLQRRKFITLIAGAATGWPPTARGQGMRRVTVVLGFGQGDHEGQTRLAAFVDAFARLGWNDRRNVALDVRWAGGNVTNYSMVAREVALAQALRNSSFRLRGWSP